jgi:5-formyltetrahydrofolate cyclo-ligase
MQDIPSQKAALRARMHAMRNALPPERRVEAAQRLAGHDADIAAHLAPSQKEQGIAGYWPIKSEIDPRPLMHKFSAEGFLLALPRITGDTVTFHAYHPGDALVAGAFGVMEPDLSAPIVTPTLILTPLLAYDEAGGRLGYGKGYYDRAFLAHPHARRIGLAFIEQRVDHVPRDAHDVLLHYVLAV